MCTLMMESTILPLPLYKFVIIALCADGEWCDARQEYEDQGGRYVLKTMALAHSACEKRSLAKSCADNHGNDVSLAMLLLKF